eukprot:TRINITY_DN67030_c4_g1_i1.p1 TRINITY_DN67030_c4_g1~~TRINITY_DN67030_c4_g1_i1.p1  ORF type:complete len:1034 (+),score=500.65 TRINITY_DN67030_c4_g1_i1:309-3104(+)
MSKTDSDKLTSGGGDDDYDNDDDDDEDLDRFDDDDGDEQALPDDDDAGDATDDVDSAMNGDLSEKLSHAFGSDSARAGRLTLKKKTQGTWGVIDLHNLEVDDNLIDVDNIDTSGFEQDDTERKQESPPPQGGLEALERMQEETTQFLQRTATNESMDSGFSRDTSSSSPPPMLRRRSSVDLLEAESIWRQDAVKQAVPEDVVVDMSHADKMVEKLREKRLSISGIASAKIMAAALNKSPSGSSGAAAAVGKWRSKARAQSQSAQNLTVPSGIPHSRSRSPSGASDGDGDGDGDGNGDGDLDNSFDLSDGKSPRSSPAGDDGAAAGAGDDKAKYEDFFSSIAAGDKLKRHVQKMRSRMRAVSAFSAAGRRAPGGSDTGGDGARVPLLSRSGTDSRLAAAAAAISATPSGRQSKGRALIKSMIRGRSFSGGINSARGPPSSSRGGAASQSGSRTARGRPSSRSNSSTPGRRGSITMGRHRSQSSSRRGGPGSASGNQNNTMLDARSISERMRAGGLRAAAQRRASIGGGSRSGSSRGGRGRGRFSGRSFEDSGDIREEDDQYDDDPDDDDDDDDEDAKHDIQRINKDGRRSQMSREQRLAMERAEAAEREAKYQEQLRSLKSKYSGVRDINWLRSRLAEMEIDRTRIADSMERQGRELELVQQEHETSDKEHVRLQQELQQRDQVIGELCARIKEVEEGAMDKKLKHLEVMMAEVTGQQPMMIMNPDVMQDMSMMEPAVAAAHAQAVLAAGGSPEELAAANAAVAAAQSNANASVVARARRRNRGGSDGSSASGVGLGGSGDDDSDDDGDSSDGGAPMDMAAIYTAGGGSAAVVEAANRAAGASGGNAAARRAAATLMMRRRLGGSGVGGMMPMDARATLIEVQTRLSIAERDLKERDKQLRELERENRQQMQELTKKVLDSRGCCGSGCVIS